VSVLKQQGISVIKKFQNKIEQGQMPASELADGIFLIISAALLLTPGFFTDTIGFILLIPLIREFIIDFGLEIFIGFGIFGSKTTSSSTTSDDIIEGEFYEVDKQNKQIKK
jgi:UPF0716 protein FxsA